MVKLGKYVNRNQGSSYLTEWRTIGGTVTGKSNNSF